MNYNYYIEQNIPFLEKGRTEIGLDCWGLIQLFYKRELNIVLPGYTECYKTTKDSSIADKIFSESLTNWENVDEPQNGDVVLCRMRNRPMHVGVYKEPGFMLHIEEGCSPILERLDGIKWQKRILGIFRLKSLM